MALTSYPRDPCGTRISTMPPRLLTSLQRSTRRPAQTVSGWQVAVELPRRTRNAAYARIPAGNFSYYSDANGIGYGESNVATSTRFAVGLCLPFWCSCSHARTKPRGNGRQRVLRLDRSRLYWVSCGSAQRRLHANTLRQRTLAGRTETRSSRFPHHPRARRRMSLGLMQCAGFARTGRISCPRSSLQCRSALLRSTTKFRLQTQWQWQQRCGDSDTAIRVLQVVTDRTNHDNGDRRDAAGHGARALRLTRSPAACHGVTVRV